MLRNLWKFSTNKYARLFIVYLKHISNTVEKILEVVGKDSLKLLAI
jgi:hypothetical protein